MTPISPDCSDGFKHPACSGDAWDPETELVVRCECSCHEKESE